MSIFRRIQTRLRPDETSLSALWWRDFSCFLSEAILFFFSSSLSLAHRAAYFLFVLFNQRGRDPNLAYERSAA